MTSVLAKHGVLFPDVPEDGLVEVLPYIQACRHLPMIFDSLGKAFAPVKSDINGNINKIQRVYDSKPEKYRTFKAVLEEEILQKNTKNGNSVAVALLWLTRGLEYIMLFLRYIVDDHNSGKKTENLVEFVKKCYEKSLKPYHGWMVQKIFSVIAHAAPWRRDFLKSLADGNTAENYEDQVIEDISLTLKTVEPNVKAIQDLLEELGLNVKDKV